MIRLWFCPSIYGKILFVERLRTDTAVRRLLEAIEYPDRVPDGESSYLLRVDGAEISAEASAGRIRLRCALTDDAASVASLATYAPGRMLREDAVLAVEPHTGEAFLWQEADASAGGDALRAFFENFLHACDWWRDRVQDAQVEPTSFSEAIIRP